MNGFLKIALTILIIISIILPCPTFAATPAKLYYAGWVPFWKIGPGTQEVALNLEKLNSVSPFSYEVKPDGTLVDKLKISSDLFLLAWLRAVQDSGTKITPTIAWFDGNAIHALLKSKTKRIAHENAITKLVKDNKFDGIDIDYEAKLAETNPYFSLFIEGLAIRLHPLKKILSCTIEPRAPVENLLAKGAKPEDIQRANDYKVLNKYCDEVRLMAYDQGIIDPFLNKDKGTNQPYAPVADPLWVEKTIKEALKQISPKKIMLGIPTYGYEYEISYNTNAWNYDRIRSYTYKQAMDLVANLNITPSRNNAGELSFIYMPASAAQASIASSSSLLASAANNLFSLAQNLSLTASGTLLSVFQNSSINARFVSFSDSKAIDDKIQLARKYKLRGVVFFKIDGEADPNLWKKIK